MVALLREALACRRRAGPADPKKRTDRLRAGYSVHRVHRTARQDRTEANAYAGCRRVAFARAPDPASMGPCSLLGASSTGGGFFGPFTTDQRHDAQHGNNAFHWSLPREVSRRDHGVVPYGSLTVLRPWRSARFLTAESTKRIVMAPETSACNSQWRRMNGQG
jgi:hypothetical protein